MFNNGPSPHVTKYEAKQAIAKLRTQEKASATKDIATILDAPSLRRLFAHKDRPMLGAKAVLIACYAKGIEQLFNALDPDSLPAVKEACATLGVEVPAAVTKLQAKQNKRDRGCGA